jgi:hypothetical protein
LDSLERAWASASQKPQHLDGDEWLDLKHQYGTLLPGDAWDSDLDAEELLKSLGLFNVQRNGRELEAECPFCKRHKFSMSLVKQGHPWQCWTCPDAGEPIGLVMKVLDVERDEAKRILEKFGARFGKKRPFHSGKKLKGLAQEAFVSGAIEQNPNIARREIVELLSQNFNIKERAAYKRIKTMGLFWGIVRIHQSCGNTLISQNRPSQVFQPTKTQFKLDLSLTTKSSTTKKPSFGLPEHPSVNEKCNVTLICACGCNRQLSGRRGKLYFDASCRKRASRARINLVKSASKYSHNVPIMEEPCAHSW